MVLPATHGRNMDILDNEEHFSISIHTELAKYHNEDLADLKWLEDTKNEFKLLLKGNPAKIKLTPVGGKSKTTRTCEDKKESFLVPAPRGKLQKKRTTRTAFMRGSSEVLTSELADADSSLDTSKCRRTTRKGRITSRPSRASSTFKCNTSFLRKTGEQKRMTKRKSSNLVDEEIVRPKRITRSRVANASMSSNFEVDEVNELKRVTRSKAVNISVSSSSSLVEEEINRPKRVTRSHAQSITICDSTSSDVKIKGKTAIRIKMEKISTSVETANTGQPEVKEKYLSPKVNNIASITSPPLVSGPFTPNSVKQQVEAFEKLFSTLASEGAKDRKKEIGLCLNTPGKNDNSLDIFSPVIKKKKSTIDSPLFICKTKNDKKEALKGLATQQGSHIEAFKSVLEEEEQCDEKTSDNEGFGEEAVEANEKQYDTDEKGVEKDAEADDEWVSDDENEIEKSKSAKKNKTVLPNTTTSVTPKTPEVAIGSYKALRSRKVQNASTSGLSLGSKNRAPKKKVNSSECLQAITQQKPVETENKEAELKKKLEKEVEALKRKEVIMKKRTEAAKRKREEKMAKAKRTREEIEKERTVAAKLKKAKGKAEKKKPVQVEEAELKSILSPFTKMNTPKQDLNVTFEKKRNQKENVPIPNNSPCLPAAPPVQQINPNDYGMVDKSDCSSEEEDDSRKKIPAWARIFPNNYKLLTQTLISQNLTNEYWYCKQILPSINEFFGVKVSSRTLKRGLNFRTSSACWNTPPIRK